MLLGRYLASGSRAFAFLLWNLFLAFIPYTLSSAAAALDRTRSPGRSFLLVFLAAPWLAFLPNAPYLVTDLMHLRTPSSVPVWYDVTMFACFAGAGCLLGAASLDTMRKVFSRRVGIVAAQGSALGALALSAGARFPVRAAGGLDRRAATTDHEHGPPQHSARARGDQDTAFNASRIISRRSEHGLRAMSGRARR